jgi:hypothetical protein
MKCLNCKKEFDIRTGTNPTCPTGEGHLVESKTYYMDDAPSDQGPYMPGPNGGLIPTGDNRRHAQTVLCNLIPERINQHGHETKIVPGRNVTFIRGMYTTSDADEQFWLDKRQGRGLCSEERWREVYLTDNQKLQFDQMRLNADRQRLTNERNELLELARKSNNGKLPEHLKDMVGER